MSESRLAAKSAKPRLAKSHCKFLPQQRPGQSFISRFFQPISKTAAQIRLEKQQAVDAKTIEERVELEMSRQPE